MMKADIIARAKGRRAGGHRGKGDGAGVMKDPMYLF